MWDPHPVTEAGAQPSCSSSDEVVDHVAEYVGEPVVTERIVFMHLETRHRFRMMITLDRVANGSTCLTWRMVFKAEWMSVIFI
ncbi:MAG: hypothetical protein KDN22_11735 [Verrucomicrobiae bacterium]|nr:hypothetical protein [Verrucomicrobiae bacterium]